MRGGLPGARDGLRKRLICKARPREVLWTRPTVLAEEELLADASLPSQSLRALAFCAQSQATPTATLVGVEVDADDVNAEMLLGKHAHVLLLRIESPETRARP